MRKRDCRVVVYFTKDELETLTQKVKKSGLSREGFLRNLVNGVEVKEAPNADVMTLIHELRRAGSNVNQVLRIAHGQGLLDVPLIRQTMDETRAAARKIVEAYTVSER